ncbi:nicotinate (nicotinamide) nucleotide adenylyltransferase [uncultured Algimonas sp.]|uniref:nicotinate (nicotinamide) nucleotide adenylyltransferase n=1 Tax=uncultured Algimonas sp. TaxID=1547920 RepID=UPI002629923E|nr:nicotinate (nicotinamide) nucleotide adenylyltransferase [uncultured Algimonas sp.]
MRPLGRPRSGLAVGLFGGSFNPAHAGHLHVAEAGLRELALDQVWWLVSPQNPLKPAQPDARQRADTIRALDLPYAMKISHIETRLETRYTVELLRILRHRNADTRFVYMIGADNLAQMPEWKDWKALFELVPVAVVARPGQAVRARLGRVARRVAQSRVSEAQAHTLKDRDPPAWTYLTLPLNPLSSSRIRMRQSAEPS